MPILNPRVSTQKYWHIDNKIIYGVEMKKYIPKEDKEKRKKEQRTDGIRKTARC